MSRRAILLFRLSPLRAELSAPALEGRRVRIYQRLIIVGIFLALLLLLILALHFEVLPQPIAMFLYTLHDNVYLPLKGNLWTKILPQGFWIWFSITGIALLTFMSWISDRSFVLRWHRIALSIVMANVGFKHALIQSARFLPRNIFPYRLASDATMHLWLDAMANLGQAGEKGSVNHGHIRTILASWNSMTALNVYRPHHTKEQMAEWAAHQLILFSVLSSPHLRREIFSDRITKDMVQHVLRFAGRESAQSTSVVGPEQPPDFDVWPEVFMLLQALDDAHGNLDDVSVQMVAMEIADNFEKRLHSVDQMSHLMHRNIGRGFDETGIMSDRLRKQATGFNGLRQRDYRLSLDVALWSSVAIGRPSLAMDVWEAWQSLSVLILSSYKKQDDFYAGLFEWVAAHDVDDDVNTNQITSGLRNEIRLYPMLHNFQIRRIVRALVRKEQAQLKAAWKNELDIDDASAAWVTSQHFDFDSLSTDAILDFSE